MAEKSQKRNDRDIPIKIEGVTRFIKNVTKCTTCADVIKMILKKLNIGKENLPYYAIFESANGVDRPLAGKTSILKTVRSWGSDSSYRLVMRKSAPAVTYIPRLSESKRQKLSQWSKSSSTSSDSEEIDKEKGLATLKESVKRQRRKLNSYRISDRELSRQLFSDDYSDDSDSMDEFMSKVDSNKLNDFWDFCNAVTESEIKRLSRNGRVKQLVNPNGTHGSDGETNKVKYAVKKKLKQCQSIDYLSESKGKQELLQKYLCDYSSHETPRTGRMKKVSRRMQIASDRYCSDNIDRLEAPPAYSVDNNAFDWSVHAESDLEQTDNDSSLEESFMNKCNVSEGTNDSGIKLKHTTGVDTHNCGNKLVDYSLSEDENDNATAEYFDIRKFWDSGNVYDEDEEMSSFMRTKMSEDFSDEGLSSMGSDEEREILV